MGQFFGFVLLGVAVIALSSVKQKIPTLIAVIGYGVIPSYVGSVLVISYKYDFVDALRLAIIADFVAFLCLPLMWVVIIIALHDEELTNEQKSSIMNKLSYASWFLASTGGSFLYYLMK
jgi:hypothetical protein